MALPMKKPLPSPMNPLHVANLMAGAAHAKAQSGPTPAMDGDEDDMPAKPMGKKSSKQVAAMNEKKKAVPVSKA